MATKNVPLDDGLPVKPWGYRKPGHRHRGGRIDWGCYWCITEHGGTRPRRISNPALEPAQKTTLQRHKNLARENAQKPARKMTPQ